jgi:uncharacterized protein YndB with AHSA1/START domain
MAQTAAIVRSTGRDRAEWFRLLDEWGATGRPYREIADWLTGEHGISKWWAQKLIVEYEQERGIRPPGIRHNGTFEVGTSKTIGVPVADLYLAFVDGRRRKRWLTDGTMKLRGSIEGRTARFDWGDGSTRVNVTFEDRGSGKSLVAVTHEKLPNAKQADATKAQWKERLASLKSCLEN